MAQRRKNITEQPNPSSASLDRRTTREILAMINREDRKVAPAVGRTLPQMVRAVDMIVNAIRRGGRLIYLGAGTSGRLGALDAAECLPTFGTTRVQAIIAGGARALWRAVEGAEDDPAGAARDLRRIRLSRGDMVAGLAASGETPYTLGGIRYARQVGAATVAITCNPSTLLERLADIAIVPIVGPEIIAGSTRMKAGTAQKLVLNMLSTAVMIRLGRVFDGWMIQMALTNRKLQRRGLAIVMRATGASRARAERALKAAGYNLSAAMLMLWKEIPADEARRALSQGKGFAAVLRAARLQHQRIKGRAHSPREPRFPRKAL